jgi:hypothetical protein
MNRLLLALAILAASFGIAHPAGQKVAPIDVTSCPSGQFVDSIGADGSVGCATPGATGGTVTSVALSVPATSIFGVTGSPVTGAGTLGLTTTGTSGGLAYFSSTSQVASSGALTANAFLTGGGAGTAPNAVAITGLVLGNGSSAPTAYGGTSCTNQFPRSLNASGAATCASVANADLANSTISGVSLGSNLNSHSHDSTLTGTSYNGSASVSDWGINLANANTWSGAQTFGETYGTVVTDSSTARTLASSDCGKLIRFTSNSAITVTLPNSLSVGCHIAMAQIGTAQVTLSAASGATLNSAHNYTKTYGQYAIIGVSVGINSGGSAATYLFTGDGA